MGLGHIHLAWLRFVLPVIYGLAMGTAAMLLHESGHLAAAAALGVRVKSIGVDWRRGLFTVREMGTLRQNMLIALAGPSVNLLLLILEPWFPMFSLANFCCVMANMLPIDGSDGFRVARCWREIRQGQGKQAEVSPGNGY
jgi:Zn-dependent protease